MELIAEQQEEAETRAARIQGRGGRSKSGTSSGRSRDRRGDSSTGRSGSRRRQQHSHTTSRSGYRGQQRQGQGPQPLKIVLARNGSSSSEESFLQLDAPASILHVGAGNGAPGAPGGAGNRSTAITSGETPSSGRVALPLRLHRHSSGGGQSSGITGTSSAGSGRRRASAARAFPLR